MIDTNTKIRVIQSKGNGFVSKVGEFCYSGNPNSFTSNNPSESRLTLFILNNDDGTKDVSVFNSHYTGQQNEMGQFIFECNSTPKIVKGVDTKVHLQSSKVDKVDLVNSVLSN